MGLKDFFLSQYDSVLGLFKGNKHPDENNNPNSNRFKELKISQAQGIATERPAIGDIFNYMNGSSSLFNPNPMELFKNFRHQNEWVDSAIRTLAIACASCEPLFKIVSKNVTDQNWIDLLTEKLENPNDHEEGFALFIKIYEDLLLYGNSYLQVRKTRGGDIHSFFLIPPTSMKVVPVIDSETGDLRLWYLQINPEIRLFSDSEVIHFKRPNSYSQIYGLSLFYPLIKTVTMDTHITESLVTFFESSFSGGLIFKQDADELVAERNREFIQAEMTGPANAGRPLLLEGNVELVADGNRYKNWDFAALKDVGRDSIFQAAGIPLSMAGVRAAHGQANQQVIESEEDVFIRYVASIQRLVFDKLDHKLIKQLLRKPKIKITAGINIKFSNRNAIESMSSAARVAVKINEYRQAHGLQPLENGGEEYVSLTNNGLIATSALIGFDPNTGEETPMIAVTDVVPKTNVAGQDISPQA